MLIWTGIASAQPIFTGREWQVASYEQAEGDTFVLPFPSFLAHGEVLAINSKGKIVSIPYTEWDELHRQKELAFTLLSTTRVKGREYLRLQRVSNQRIYYLPTSGYDYRPLLADWSVYDGQIERMNREYRYATNRELLIRPLEQVPVDWNRGHSYTFPKDFHETAYIIQWLDHEHVVAPEGYRVFFRYAIGDPDSYSIDADDFQSSWRRSKVDIRLLDRSDFLSAGQIDSLHRVKLTADSLKQVEIQAEQQRTRIAQQRQADSVTALEQQWVDTKHLLLYTWGPDEYHPKYSSSDYYAEHLGIEVFNCFDKTIKFIDIQARLMNRFGDPAPDCRGRTTARAKRVSGPVEPREYCMFILEFDYCHDEHSHHKRADYNGAIEQIAITRMTITFLDGTTHTIPNP